MNWAISLLGALLPFFKQLIDGDSTPRGQAVKHLNRQYTQLRRHFKRKDSEGGREITKQEHEILMHIQNKITELLTTKNK